MSCSKSMCGVTRRNRVRNEEIRRRYGLQRSLSEKGKAAVLQWFGHVERMEGEFSKKQLSSRGGGKQGERQTKENVDGWSERLLSERGLTIPEAKKCVKDRREWKRIFGERRR